MGASDAATFENVAKQLTAAGLVSTALELYCELADRGVYVDHLIKYFRNNFPDALPPRQTDDAAAATSDDDEDLPSRPGGTRKPSARRATDDHDPSVSVQVVDISKSGPVVRKVEAQAAEICRLQSLYSQATKDFHKFARQYFKQRAVLSDTRRLNGQLEKRLKDQASVIEEQTRLISTFAKSPQALHLVESVVVPHLLKVCVGAPVHHLTTFTRMFAQLLSFDLPLDDKRAMLRAILELWRSPSSHDRRQIVQVFRGYCLAHLGSGPADPEDQSGGNATANGAISAPRHDPAPNTASQAVGLPIDSEIAATVVHVLRDKMKQAALVSMSANAQLLLIELNVELDSIDTLSTHALMAALETFADSSCCTYPKVRIAALSQLLTVLNNHKLNDAALVRYLPATYRIFARALADPVHSVCAFTLTGAATHPNTCTNTKSAHRSSIFSFLLELDVRHECLLSDRGVVHQVANALCDTDAASAHPVNAPATKSTEANAENAAEVVFMRQLNRFPVAVQSCLRLVLQCLATELGVHCPDHGDNRLPNESVCNPDRDADRLRRLWLGAARCALARPHDRPASHHKQNQENQENQESEPGGRDEGDSSAVSSSDTLRLRSIVERWDGLRWFLSSLLPRITIEFVDCMLRIVRHDQTDDFAAPVSSDIVDVARAANVSVEDFDASSFALFCGRLRDVRVTALPQQGRLYSPDSLSRHAANTLLKLLEHFHNTFGGTFNVNVTLAWLAGRVGVSIDAGGLLPSIKQLLCNDLSIDVTERWKSAQEGDVHMVGRSLFVHVLVRYTLRYAKWPNSAEQLCHCFHNLGLDVDVEQLVDRMLQEPPAAVATDGVDAQCCCLLETILHSCASGRGGWRPHDDFVEVTRQLSTYCFDESKPCGPSLFAMLLRRLVTCNLSDHATLVRVLEFWAVHCVAYGTDAPLQSGSANAHTTPQVVLLGVLTFSALLRQRDDNGNFVFPPTVRAMCATYLVRTDYRYVLRFVVHLVFTLSFASSNTTNGSLPIIV